MPRKKATAEPVTDTGEKRTYLLVKDNGKQQRITIPAHWTITFGPLAPGLPRTQKYPNRTDNPPPSFLALRIYEGKVQRAVFTDMRSFRDESIQLEDVEDPRFTPKLEVGTKPKQAEEEEALAW